MTRTPHPLLKSLKLFYLPLLWTFFFGLSSLYAHYAQAETPLAFHRPKVVVITSDNGGGHNAAAEAIEKTLGPAYDVVKLNLLKGKLGSHDTRFMEYFAREKWTLLNLMRPFQPMIDFYIKTRLYTYIKNTLAAENPDLIVSVYPIGNKAYSDVAKELGVKSLIIPTDLLLDMSLRFIRKGDEEKNKHIIVCRAYENMNGDQQVLANKGLLQQSVVTGYPVRPQFNRVAKLYRTGDQNFLKELEVLREKLAIAPMDKVVLITPMAPLGFDGVGEQAVLDYVNFAVEDTENLLPAQSQKLHFIVVTGKNEGFYEKVKVLSQEMAANFHSRVVIHPEKFLPAEDYAKYMAMADVPIIKPGGATLNEMVAMGKKVLIKSDSAQAVPWEKANMDFMVKNDWAILLNYTQHGRVDKKDYQNKLKVMLERPNLPLETPINEFDVKFKSLVDEIVVNETVR